ncbi:MAG: tetratricopeptide repeat protein [Parasphingopyxis sp.]|uniref:tetratricopeptide repeat protein n=1 Tax=Parasphingopyxis sp. TaxID=1920299 RepID=UPI003F9FEEC5
MPVLAVSGAAEASNPLSDYARARVADASGQIGVAAEGYASALSGAPFDETLAARAYRRAVAAGDRNLALRAAQSLQAANALPPDGELLFLIEALEDGDWGEARRVVDRIEEQGLFSSLAPVMRAWIAFGADDTDPLAILDAESEESSPSIYEREHRALLLLAMGRYEEGITATLALNDVGPPRFLRLRLAAAARLVQARRRDEALAFLPGDSRAERTARAVIERRRSLPGAIDSAADGIGELFVRLAADINRQNASALALTVSRFATFIAPDNSVGWFVTSGILNQADQEQAALLALDGVGNRDPFYSDVQDMRVQLLAETDEPQAALELARERAEARNATAADWQRYGERYAALDLYDEAAEAYGRAVTLAGGDDAPWSAWLLYGGALLDADRWDESRPALERAVELAPNQPIALNYLGYALLERREDLETAEDLIRRASELSPDSASITDSLGWVYYIQGDLERAIPTLERAARGEPAEPTINEHLGDAYWTAGRRRDARFAWQAALVSADDEAAARIRQKLDIGLTAETASP